MVRERPNIIEVTEVSLKHLIYNLVERLAIGVSPPFIISNSKFFLQLGSNVNSLTSYLLWPLKLSQKIPER